MLSISLSLTYDRIKISIIFNGCCMRRSFGERAVQVHDSVREILKRKGNEVWSIAPDSSVYRAIEMMADRHVGALLVMAELKLVGIISERDYARKVILNGR